MTENVTVFISYHSPDYVLAEKMKNCLEDLSSKFDVFVDKTSIAPGHDFRAVIKENLSKAQWFIIICTGFPRPDVDMAWSFFELGQFSATLPAELAKDASRRMVCLYDQGIPSVLSPLQGVKVNSSQKSGAQIDLDGNLVKTNSQYDETYIYDLFLQMLNNEPFPPLRDVNEKSVREDIRVQCHEIINGFEHAGSTYPIEDRALQPRFWYELSSGGTLNAETRVVSDNDALNTLFSLATRETTWGTILGEIMKPAEPKPLWADDVERSASDLAKNKIPRTSTSKCVLNDRVYRAFTARYQLFKDNRKTVYVSFLESIKKPFDLKRASGILLSALILGVRFHERLIPLHKLFADDSTDKEQLLLDFYSELQAVEIEALQYGLKADASTPDDIPILTVITDKERRKVVEHGIKQWTCDRREISNMFLASAELSKNAHSYSKRLSEILKDMDPTNKAFISVLSQELGEQLQLETDDGAADPPQPD